MNGTITIIFILVEWLLLFLMLGISFIEYENQLKHMKIVAWLLVIATLLALFFGGRYVYEKY